jgi:hypothetical protein
MIVKLKQRIQSYLDEVIFEGSVHTYGLPPSKDATRREMIKLHMAIIGLAGAAILVFLLIAALARPSFAAALWPHINAGLQLTWVKVLALAILIGAGWLLLALAIVKLRQRIRSYLDEVIIEGGDDDDSMPPIEDATRREMIMIGALSYSLIGALVLFLLLITTLLAWPFVAAALWPYISAGLQLTWVKVIALAVLVGVGWLLFQVRENFRWFYGIGEVCVGIAACWVGLNSANTEGLASAIALATGVYVIVRGLDNYYQGMKEMDPGTA